MKSTIDALTFGYYFDGTNQVVNPKWTSPNFEGGSTHNLITSTIRFPLGGFFDRSNAIIWNNDARLDDYDPDNPTDFRIDVLNQYKLAALLNTGYKGMFFMKVSSNSIDQRFYFGEILLYNTDKTNESEIKVLKYTNDISKAIDDGCGSYIVDGNGYVILTD